MKNFAILGKVKVLKNTESRYIEGNVHAYLLHTQAEDSDAALVRAENMFQDSGFKNLGYEKIGELEEDNENAEECIIIYEEPCEE